MRQEKGEQVSHEKPALLEKPAFLAPGLPAFLVLFVLLLLTIVAFVVLIANRSTAAGWMYLADITAMAVALFGLGGLVVVNPNEARVLQLFGSYVGTASQPGFWWTNPFTHPRRKVSQRVRNFES